jgi:hypothetical protein
MKSIVRTTAAVVGALITVAVAAGCGGSSGGSASSSHHAAASGYSSAAQIAKALSCTGYQGGYGEVGASDSGTCDYGFDNVILSVFASETTAAAFRAEIASEQTTTTFLYGSTWSVQCGVHDACVSAQKKLGGRFA